jgi:hypothetical protein
MSATPVRCYALLLIPKSYIIKEPVLDSMTLAGDANIEFIGNDMCPRKS